MSRLTDHERPAFAAEDPLQAAVDDALQTYPVAPAPPHLSAVIRNRIRALQPAPRFRLAWMDYAVSLFAAGMAGLGMLGWQFITPQTAALAQIQVLLFLQSLNRAFLLWPSLLGGTLLAAAALLAAAGLFARRRALWRA